MFDRSSTRRRGRDLSNGDEALGLGEEIRGNGDNVLGNGEETLGLSILSIAIH